MVANVVKLMHKALLQLVINGRHSERRWLVLEEVAIGCGCQVKLEVCNSKRVIERIKHEMKEQSVVRRQIK